MLHKLNTDNPAEISSPLSRLSAVDDPFLIFFHTGKTGGTTFASIISSCVPYATFFSSHMERQNGFGAWLVDDIREKWDGLTESEQRMYNWTGGHVPVRVHEVFPRDCLYFGMVRNPSQRWLSSLFYNHIVRGNRTFDQDTSIEKLVEDQRGTKFANPQTRQYSGAKPDEVITDEHLAQAKQNIEKHFLFVGLTERFDDAVALALVLFGWPLLNGLYEKKNKTPPHPLRQSITPETIKVIESVHALDMELYAFCARRFEDDLQNLPLGIRMKWWSYRGFIAIWIKIKSQLSLLRRLGATEK